MHSLLLEALCSFGNITAAEGSWQATITASLVVLHAYVLLAREISVHLRPHLLCCFQLIAKVILHPADYFPLAFSNIDLPCPLHYPTGGSSNVGALGEGL